MKTVTIHNQYDDCDNNDNCDDDEKIKNLYISILSLVIYNPLRTGYIHSSLKGHYDEVVFSWCHILNKRFKIIFIYPCGKISSPF